MEVFKIEPSVNMMDVLGHAGYTLEHAIADLIDNSISAQAKNINIFINTKTANPYIYILDDGLGMTLEQLKNASILGQREVSCERSSFDLGRYSTGLKSATKSIADNLYVSSKKKNNKINTIQIDYKHIRQTQKWEAFVTNEFEYSNLIKEQGTLVFCDSLRIKGDIYSKLEHLETSLSHIFSKYIQHENLNITIQTSLSTKNKKAIPYWNPFELIENKSTRLIHQETFKYKKGTISINSYILPVYNNLSSVDQSYMEGKGLMEQQGFYIYRNKRLIQESGWLSLPGLKLDNKSQYARIEVDITSNLDEEFDVNFSKSSIKVPDDLVSKFLDIAKKARTESKNGYNYNKTGIKKPTIQTKEEKIWTISHSSDGMILSVNPNHPLLNEICSQLNTYQKKKLFNLLSKSLPINMIQNQETSVQSYTKLEIMNLIEDMYNKYINEGLSLGEIKKKMVSIEPFKSRTDELIEFFGNKED